MIVGVYKTPNMDVYLLFEKFETIMSATCKEKNYAITDFNLGEMGNIPRKIWSASSAAVTFQPH